MVILGMKNISLDAYSVKNRDQGQFKNIFSLRLLRTKPWQGYQASKQNALDVLIDPNNTHP